MAENRKRGCSQMEAGALCWATTISVNGWHWSESHSWRAKCSLCTYKLPPPSVPSLDSHWARRWHQSEHKLHHQLTLSSSMVQPSASLCVAVTLVSTSALWVVNSQLQLYIRLKIERERERRSAHDRVTSPILHIRVCTGLGEEAACHLINCCQLLHSVACNVINIL